MTGLFYENGRIYFTQSSDPNLYMRYFSVESGMVGAERFTVAGNIPGWTGERNGMFLVAAGCTGLTGRVVPCTG